MRMKKSGLYFILAFIAFLIAQLFWTFEVNGLFEVFNDTSKYWGQLFTVSGFFGLLGAFQMYKGK